MTPVSSADDESDESLEGAAVIVIGVLLVLVASGAVALVLMAPDVMSNVIQLTAIGITVNATPLALFVAGAVTLALFGLGFPMITQGIRRNAKRRKELHGLRKEQAAASTSTPTAAGEQSSRGDRPQRDSGTSTSSPGI